MSLEILGKSQTTEPVYSNGKAKERNIMRNVYTIRKRAVHERDFPQPLEFSVRTISFERVTFAFLNIAFHLVISFSVLITFLHTKYFSFTLKVLRINMRVKNPPRQHQVDMNVANGTENDTLSYDSKISRSEPCLRFVNGDLEISMEPIPISQQIYQDSGPGIDEALDLAMPTRSRCKHEHYTSCFSIAKDLLGEASEAQLEAIDLSKKDGDSCEELPATTQNDLKTTFLYKMLTDSSFLENLRGNKQSSNHACLFCKKKFSTEEELTDHLNVRKDESNQVACCACGKTFAQKRYLRYHQRCHSERSKFTCDICTKNYSRLDNLTRHNTFHTNPDKFPCTSCDRTFARKDLFKKHIKCHENRHRYYCSICDKYFKGPLSLDNHKKLVHSNV